MDDRWAWHAPHRDAVSGELDATAAKAAGAAATPVLLDVHVWTAGEETHSERRRWQVTDGARLQVLPNPDSTRPLLHRARWTPPSP